MHQFLFSGTRFVWTTSLKNIKFRRGWRSKRLFSESSLSKSIANFEELITNRRTEANRSVVVQVNSEKSYSELYSCCSRFGNIKSSHHYTIQQGELHYILLEFEKEETAAQLIDSACYNEDYSGVPVRSPFLWFRTRGRSLSKQEKGTVYPENDYQLNSVDGIQVLSDNELNDLLRKATKLEDQMTILHRATCLNDLGIRLRFLAGRQVENSISGMFPNVNCRPFGSTVNGFGKVGCDLDLILRFDKEIQDKSNSRLVFHTKENLVNGRSQTQRQMECLGDLLHLFLPGVSHVRRILQARVPIIRFHHDYLNLEIDLSMSNMTGSYMSELLYMLGEIDNRVRPLTFCLRRWAYTVGLTNPSPGRWITNFSLTCLIIYFLQQLKSPILPTIDNFFKLAKPSDSRLTEDGIDCSFLRDYKEMQFVSKNKASLGELLLQFFEFYSQYDFNNRAISLNQGKSILKPDHSAIYIVNPLEKILNISKNISLEECERLRIEVRNAAWVLESEMENNLPSDEKLKVPWGLLNLFRSPEKSIIRPNMFFKSRMVDISDLFERDEATLSLEGHKVEYKNSYTKSQVQGIKAKAKADLKQLKLDSNKGSRRGS